MMSSSEVLEAAKQQFRDTFHSEPEIAVFAPGRVNLIGEHTDYNDGFVLPFALPYRTVMVGSRSEDPESKVVTTAFPGLDSVASFHVDESLTKGSPEWANYIKGTVFQYLEDLPPGCSFKASIVSNVPLGSGLSSSAALEVCTGTFLEKLYGLTVPSVTKALRCQKAEHTFADMPCGIMDQYISAMGAEGSLLLIDCRTNEAQLISFGNDDVTAQCRLVVTNSNVKHKLSDSEYPLRVKQCREAVEALQQGVGGGGGNSITAFRDATLEQLETCKDAMSPEAYRRAKHCIGEDKRTMETVKALSEGDFATVGQLMTSSHISLRDDFEVSCPELDCLVNIANSVEGVLGSRMTGGGFGGCTVTLVKAEAADELQTRLKSDYADQTGKTCVCYVVVPSAGAGEC